MAIIVYFIIIGAVTMAAVSTAGAEAAVAGTTVSPSVGAATSTGTAPVRRNNRKNAAATSVATGSSSVAAPAATTTNVATPVTTAKPSGTKTAAEIAKENEEAVKRLQETLERLENEKYVKNSEKAKGLEESPLVALGSYLALILAVLTGMALYPKRHIRFYRNDKDVKSAPVFTIVQTRRFEFPHQKYRMEDAAGNLLATFEKNVFTNVFRRRWWIVLPDGRKFLIKEDSIILSLFRRLVPVIGQFIRTNFVFFDLQYDPNQTRPIAIFKRKFELFDNYMLDLRNDPAFTIPRKVAIGLSILLDTGEKR